MPSRMEAIQAFARLVNGDSVGFVFLRLYANVKRASLVQNLKTHIRLGM